MHWRSIQTGTTFLVVVGLAAVRCTAQTVQGVVVSDSASGSFYLSASAPGHYRVRILLGHGGLAFSPAFDLDTNKVVEHRLAIPDFPKAVLEAYLPGDVTNPAAVRPSVREAVTRLEFFPAELNGAPVPQLFEIGVDFRFDNTPFRLHGNHVITITATPPS